MAGTRKNAKCTVPARALQAPRAGVSGLKALRLYWAASLVGFQIRIGDVEHRYAVGLRLSPRDEIADDVIRLDARAAFQIAQHRRGHRRATVAEEGRGTRRYRLARRMIVIRRDAHAFGEQLPQHRLAARRRGMSQIGARIRQVPVASVARNTHLSHID